MINPNIISYLVNETNLYTFVLDSLMFANNSFSSQQHFKFEISVLVVFERSSKKTCLSPLTN